VPVVTVHPTCLRRLARSATHRPTEPLVLSSASVIVVGLLVQVVAGGPDDTSCKRAAKRYEAMQAEVADTLRDYEHCISASRARDTCETEFGDLNLAPAGFERAVQEYGRECR